MTEHFRDFGPGLTRYFGFVRGTHFLFRDAVPDGAILGIIYALVNIALETLQFFKSWTLNFCVCIHTRVPDSITPEAMRDLVNDVLEEPPLSWHVRRLVLASQMQLGPEPFAIETARIPSSSTRTPVPRRKRTFPKSPWRTEGRLCRLARALNASASQE